MDNVDSMLDAMTARLRDEMVGDAYELAAADPLWQRIAGGIATFFGTLLALAILAAILGGLAAAARYGWEFVG